MTVIAPPKKPRQPRRDTRARIIDCAIALFNRHGLQSVSIEQICDNLQISTGNLTYHFRRKDDLIRATLDVLKSELLVALESPNTVNTPQQAAEYLIRTYHTFWAFRFYFNALEYLLTDNPTMRQEYAAIRSWIIDAHTAAVSVLASRGAFLPQQAPNNFHLLSENIWALLMNWLRHQQVERPEAIVLPKSALFDIALHQWSLCQLWLEPRFSQVLLEAFESLLKESAPSV